MVTSELVDRAEKGDPEALEQLDASGLLLGAEETLAEYAERLRSLRRNIEEMEGELQREGTFTVEGLTVQRGGRIPGEVFIEALSETERLYGFRLDWVPGFFINPRYSLLFGGCAFYFYPDFFALFIIRRAFATRTRWLIYERRELLAHELCHVARIAYGSRQFEEMFAYQTASSAFRRLSGSIFRGQAEAFWLVGSTLGLLVAQFVQTLALPWVPVWPFWCLTGGVLAWLVLHLAVLRRVWRQALAHAEWLAPGRARTLLFRCTDAEVAALARQSTPAAAQAWFEQNCQAQVRWRVTRARCQAPLASPEPGS